MIPSPDRKSTRLNSSHTVIYTLSLHDALPISDILHVNVRPSRSHQVHFVDVDGFLVPIEREDDPEPRSEEHTSELQSHSDLHSFPTRRSSDLRYIACKCQAFTIASSSFRRC